MTTIVRRPAAPTDGRAAPPAAVWAAVAARTREWLASHGVALRDATLLLPYAQLLPLAREAFGRSSVWLPRIETTQTLSAGLGPPPAAEFGQVSFDATLDALVARRLLRSRRWGEAWARRDPRGFERAVAAVVSTAHAVLRAAAAVPPALRARHWAAAREALPPLSGPGSTERLLALVAIEWASLAPAPASDRLFAWRPAAWIALRAGGADPLTDSLLAHAVCPTLLLDADDDLPLSAPGGWPAEVAAPTVAVCAGFELEAQSAAAQVVEHLRRGETPVALIAQDRLLVRRVRALLEREAVAVEDETGWKLSTTRAAALVMALLKAARPDASSDAVLDWLKALPGRGGSFSAALDAFESWLRRAGIARVSAIDAACAEAAAVAASDDAVGAAVGAGAAVSPDSGGAGRAERAERAGRPERPEQPEPALAPVGGAAQRLWAAEAPVLRRLLGDGRRPLSGWIDALRDALVGCGAWPMLRQDDAGRVVLATLRLLPPAAAGSAWALAAHDLVFGLSAFTDWVDRVLEEANFTPPLSEGPAAETAAEVVITPLPRAMLRPFAAVVFPGADERHLGGSPAADGLLGDAAARALGMADSAARRRAELLAFGQLLRAPRITFLRRRLDGTEPLAASSLVLRLELALADAGRRFAPWQDPRGERRVAALPMRPSAPPAADRLPERLSASACEALRACPYRFFAVHLLRLGEHQELDGEVEKRDYGNWLHAVLHWFHQNRGEPADAATETAGLLAIAEESREQQGIPAADFVPWAASFASLAPRYIAWLQERDRAGWRWSGGEVERVVEPEGFGGTALRGIIDRIDVRQGRPEGGVREAGDLEPSTELIDYKTGAAAGFRKKLGDPLEDTQLAFYAALMPAGLSVAASYLALDAKDRIDIIAHPEVTVSAAALRAGLAHDLQRIRQGHGLPALGTGAACEHCTARGVCRRDHWSAGAEDSDPEARA